MLVGHQIDTLDVRFNICIHCIQELAGYTVYLMYLKLKSGSRTGTGDTSRLSLWRVFYSFSSG